MRWARAGKWDERKARIAEKVAERTEEDLAAWRARTVRELGALRGKVLDEAEDVLLSEARLGDVVRLVELEDRLRGGGPKVTLTGNVRGGSDELLAAALEDPRVAEGLGEVLGHVARRLQERQGEEA